MAAKQTSFRQLATLFCGVFVVSFFLTRAYLDTHQLSANLRPNGLPTVANPDQAFDALFQYTPQLTKVSGPAKSNKVIVNGKEAYFWEYTIRVTTADGTTKNGTIRALLGHGFVGGQPNWAYLNPGSASFVIEGQSYNTSASTSTFLLDNMKHLVDTQIAPLQNQQQVPEGVPPPGGGLSLKVDDLIQPGAGGYRFPGHDALRGQLSGFDVTHRPPPSPAYADTMTWSKLINSPKYGPVWLSIEGFSRDGEPPEPNGIVAEYDSYVVSVKLTLPENKGLGGGNPEFMHFAATSVKVSFRDERKMVASSEASVEGKATFNPITGSQIDYSKRINSNSLTVAKAQRNTLKPRMDQILDQFEQEVRSFFAGDIPGIDDPRNGNTNGGTTGGATNGTSGGNTGGNTGGIPFDTCPVPSCAAPPDGCRYVPSEERDAEGCPRYPCGQLVCDVPQCPTPACAAPEPGCRYVPSEEKNDDGCPRYPCGQLVCDDPTSGGTHGNNGGTTGGNMPSCLRCDQAPAGCAYSNRIEANGCILQCGNLVCENSTGGSHGGIGGQPCKDADTCSASITLPAGCYLVPELECPVNCGQFDVQCGANTGGTTGGDECVSVDCAAPPPGCEYAGVQFKDGCQVSCGELVCEDRCLLMDCPFGCENGQCVQPAAPDCDPAICANGKVVQTCDSSGQPLVFAGGDPCFSEQQVMCDGGLQPGDTKPAGDGCNTCFCQPDGSFACTEIACGPDIVCNGKYVAGETYVADDGCNTCVCNEDGSSSCTRKACVTQDDKCTSTNDCSAGELCSTELGDCLSACPPGAQGCPAVCAGVCVPWEGPDYCFSSQDCSQDFVCSTEYGDCQEVCTTGETGEQYCLDVCAGTCIDTKVSTSTTSVTCMVRARCQDPFTGEFYEVPGCNINGTVLDNPCADIQNVVEQPTEFEDQVLVNEPEPIEQPQVEVVEYEAELPNYFDDLDADTLEATAANNLAARGIIGGFPDGTFKPVQFVNRAEAAKFLLLSRYDEVPAASSNGTFIDVIPGEWYEKYVVTAARLGVITGYADRTFRPANPVNTAEFLKMLSKTFGLPENLDYSYSDVPSDAWFAIYAGSAEKYNLFPGRQNRLLPEAQLTRSEVAIAIYQLLRGIGQ